MFFFKFKHLFRRFNIATNRHHENEIKKNLKQKKKRNQKSCFSVTD